MFIVFVLCEEEGCTILVRVILTNPSALGASGSVDICRFFSGFNWHYFSFLVGGRFRDSSAVGVYFCGVGRSRCLRLLGLIGQALSTNNERNCPCIL
jgi:hypothetical protein